MLKRKIDKVLSEWKQNPMRKPLIVKGARQVGKTESIRAFARENYRSVVEINFALQPKYATIFQDGYEVDSIVRNISFINPTAQLIPHETLIFFDELQDYPDCATSLKAFKIDGRYDVVCSGSLMGIYYQRIEMNSVGYKEDFEMHSMDFEEFLWAKGYSEEMVDTLYGYIYDVKPYPKAMLDTMFALFREYMVIGGMPEVVNRFVEQGTFTGILAMQKQLLLDYEEDITKYASGFDKAKVLAVFRHIPAFLAKENKRFQVTKIAGGARNREYIGAVEWLQNAGIVNVCHCMNCPELPMKGNYDPKQYKIYFKDTGLLIASLDDEAQDDLRSNSNLGTYKGALYENIVADMLVKQGYGLYYYKSDKPAMEMDFFVRNASSLIPVEVKAGNNATPSLRRLVESAGVPDVKCGIKLCMGNVGLAERVLSLPYFATFMLRRFLRDSPALASL